MGILDNNPNQEINPSERIANMLKQQTRNTFIQLVQSFNQGAQSFWDNPDASPAEIALSLGEDAKEIFELHGKIGALLAEIKPEAIQPGLSVVGQFQYNSDGTVTIIS
jgi:hypothetical protein